MTKNITSSVAICGRHFLGFCNQFLNFWWPLSTFIRDAICRFAIARATSPFAVVLCYILYPFVFTLTIDLLRNIYRMFSFFLIYDMIESVGLRPAGSSKKKNKGDQEQENPDDLREPSTEEDERLLSTLEYELPEDDMKDVSDTQNTTGEYSTGERKLIRIDKRSESFL